MSTKTFIGIIVAVLLVVGIGFAVVSHHRSPAPSSRGSLASLSTGPAPWQPEYRHLSDRLLAIHLPLLGAEGTAQHIHAHLDIYVNGKAVEVPADIGIPPDGGITPLHTHDASGIIHVESPDAKAVYTLGQFFDIWGVQLTATSVGGYRDTAGEQLAVYDNGQKVGNPAQLAIKAHHEIVVAYGTAAQVSSHIPDSYHFPAGL